MVGGGGFVSEVVDFELVGVMELVLVTLVEDVEVGKVGRPVGMEKGFPPPPGTLMMVAVREMIICG